MQKQNEQPSEFTEVLKDGFWGTVKAILFVFLCGYAGMPVAEKLLNH